MTSDSARSPGVFDQAFLTDLTDVTEVLLVRHAQQQIDPSGPVGDWFDPPLSEHGREQARLVGAALSIMKFDAIYCSTLQRARETAEAIAQHHRLEPQAEHDLREIEIFRDLPPKETAERSVGRELLKAVRYRMLEERSWDVYPYSESSHEFRKRTVNAIEIAIARHPAGRICIVCHGGVINAYTGHIIGSPYDVYFRPAHASVSIVAAGRGRRAVQLLNDVHHLSSAEGRYVTY